jgi:glutaredoxin
MPSRIFYERWTTDALEGRAEDGTMTLYITADCRTCSIVRESLDEVAIAHETVVVPAHEAPDRLPEGTQAPVLVDDEKVIQGVVEIHAYIEDLWKLRADWLKYQSDTCYLD